MIVDISYHMELISIISPLNQAAITASFIEINFSIDKKQACEKLNIELEVIQGKLRLITKSIPTKVFKSIENFLLIKEMATDANIIIIEESDIISYIQGKTFLNFKEDKNNFLISNVQAYLGFQNLLKTYESESDDSFHFVDAYNKDLRKITFISLSDKGRLNITYDLKIPKIDSNKDYNKGFLRFSKCFDNENKSLAKFLKAATINTASSFSNEERMQLLFESLDTVVEKARINFEVYLNNLSIDQIKKDYDDVKSKYFNSLSDILSKLSQNILALPIAISSLLFSIEKVKDNPLFIAILLGTVIVTTIYVSLLLRIHFKDLLYIRKIFEMDYLTLIGNKFFIKYPKELNLFIEVRDRIIDKVNFLKIIIESYFWAMNLANIIIVGLLLNTLTVPLTGIVLLSFVELFILTLVRNYVLEETSTEEF